MRSLIKLQNLKFCVLSTALVVVDCIQKMRDDNEAKLNFTSHGNRKGEGGIEKIQFLLVC